MGTYYVAVCDGRKEYVQPDPKTQSIKFLGWMYHSKILVYTMLTEWLGHNVRLIADDIDDDYNELKRTYTNITEKMVRQLRDDGEGV